MLPKNQPIDNLILRGPWRAQLALREMVADQDEQLAHIRLICVFFFELLVPVVQRKTFASSLHLKLRQLVSSGICPFSCSRVTQNSPLFFLGADQCEFRYRK
jgi:hypothetical protein